MNPCQEAKLIVDAIIGLKQSSWNIPRLTVIGYLSSAQCEKTRLVREITAYLMTLKNREDAAKVASLIEMAYANTNMELPMLAMVEQKTTLHTGRFMHFPPNRRGQGCQPACRGADAGGGGLGTGLKSRPETQLKTQREITCVGTRTHASLVRAFFLIPFLEFPGNSARVFKRRERARLGPKATQTSTR